MKVNRSREDEEDEYQATDTDSIVVSRHYIDHESIG